MLNRVVLIGRLTRDPEMRFTPSGVAVANFSIACQRPFTNAQGEREVDFIDVVAWRKQAENCSQYLRKGHMAAIDGRLQIRSYETQDGQRRKVAEVVADSVEFLTRPQAASAGPDAFEPEPAGETYEGGAPF